MTCTELLISLHNNWHLFADGFVTVRPIAMKFGWDKENVSCLKFRKFHLNPTNFNRKLTMMFKLDLKKVTLTAIRTPVQNGLMQKIFCTQNEHLHAFYAPTKNRTNWMRASCWFLFLKKIGHYFWRRVYMHQLYGSSWPPWCRHRMETFAALLAHCEGNPPVSGGFPSQRPVTRSFDVFSDLRLNKRLSKQSRHRWFETPLRSLWRHCNDWFRKRLFACFDADLIP